MNNIEKAQDRKQERLDIIKLSTLSIIILIILMLLSSGCYYKCQEYTYMDYVAVYQDMDSLKNAVNFDAPEEITAPGGIYYKQGFVFINEQSKGIHIIDDTNPSDPKSVGFLTIPGNFAMAAKGDYLYADNYTDLVVFDISDESNPQLVGRVEDVFENFASINSFYDKSINSIVTYEQVQRTGEDCGDGGDVWGPYFALERTIDADFSMPLAMEKGGGSNGVAGSMARFVIDDETLYGVDLTSLRPFDITNPLNPAEQNVINLGWGIETIFPYEDKLFIGTQTGMHIMDNADKLNPKLLSTYAHVQSCDPVVVQGNYAYVTLRSGNSCQGFTNQLEVIDISDATNPSLVKVYEMINPHGLAINNECLFICEGSSGLKKFNVDLNDPTKITQTAFHEGVDAFDVISLPNILMMIGKDGFYQYNYNCGQELQYLSTITFADPSR